MGLASSLASLADGTLPKSFEGLKSHIDSEWISASLAKSGVATVRRRKEPDQESRPGGCAKRGPAYDGYLPFSNDNNEWHST